MIEKPNSFKSLKESLALYSNEPATRNNIYAMEAAIMEHCHHMMLKGECSPAINLKFSIDWEGFYGEWIAISQNEETYDWLTKELADCEIKVEYE